MQSFRPATCRLPQVLLKSAAAPSSRSMSLHPQIQQFSPLFRLLDDFERISRPSHFNETSAQQLRLLTPKFDVREIAGSYELQGELPGVEQQDINIEWTDEKTLTISGRSTTSTEARSSSTQADATPAPEAVLDDAASTTSDGSYQKPSVEDEDFTPASSSTAAPSAVAAPEPAQQQQQQVQPTETTEAAHEDSPRYWLSERASGPFSRSFSFPGRVDQEAVRASLKNGILSIVVPKAEKPQTRRIQIE